MFSNFGDFLQGVRRSDTPGQRTDPRLLQQRAAPAGSGEQIPGEGGFVVPGEFSQQLIQRAYLTGQLMSRAFEMPLNSASLKFPVVDETSRVDGARFGGIRGYWQNEADAAKSSKPRFGLRELTAKKLIILTYITDELAGDGLAAFISAGFAKEAVFKIEDGMVNGDGAGKPHGVLNSGALITVPKESNQAPATLLTANVVNMWSRMWAGGRDNAVWIVNQELEPQLLTLSLPVGTSGGSVVRLYTPSQSEDEPNRLLGRPIFPSEYCQAPGKVGDICFLDCSRIALGMRESLSTAISIHVNFLSDEQVFRWVVRCDAASLDSAPVTPFNGTTTTSGFVTLAAR